eukprot:6460037-Alexandrium_andersonii.AAC.1
MPKPHLQRLTAQCGLTGSWVRPTPRSRPILSRRAEVGAVRVAQVAEVAAAGGRNGQPRRRCGVFGLATSPWLGLGAVD